MQGKILNNLQTVILKYFFSDYLKLYEYSMLSAGCFYAEHFTVPLIKFFVAVYSRKGNSS